MTRTALPLALAAALTATPAPAQRPSYYEPELTREDRDHWAFKPVRRPDVPNTSGRESTNPVDAFVRAKLAEQGLTPAPEADRRTLIRRLSFDLTGLPPTPDEVDAFLRDTSPDAYETVVERLLASPHFGERQAQHWLDVVRFAESNGYEADRERPHAWRYRDYVVRSFNADKPYDVFLTEQVAGDELAAGKDPRAAADLLVATGMHRCGPVHLVGGNADKEVVRQEVLTEVVNGLGSAVLGLTMGCTRCHDHKFDPLSQGDYYRLQAFFAGAQYVDVDLSTAADKPARQKQIDALNAEIAPLKKRVAALDAPYRAKLEADKRAKLAPKFAAALAVPADKRTPEQKKLAADAAPLLKVTWDEVLAALTPAERAERAALRDRQHALEAKMPPPPAAAWAIQNVGDTPPTHILKRGEVHRKSVVVPPGVPRVAAATPVEPKTRTDLARWLTSADNPLTARVMANRLWQHHFGRGIVASPNDFGTRGDPPTHPELLDWLAAELVNPSPPTRGAAWPRHPWSLKHLHRLMVLSATYRQASDAPPTPAAVKADPDNHLLWRMNRRRLDAEAIRDATLAAAGTLNRAVGGRSVKVPLEPEVYDLIFTEGEPDGLWPVTPDAAQHTRRSLYLFAKRNVRLPMFEAFDQPDTLNSCAARPVSVFAPQALILMNGPFVQDQAKVFAASLFAAAGADAGRQVEALYTRAVGRPPRAEEKTAAVAFLAEQTAALRERVRARLPVGLPADAPADADPAALRALADLAVVVLNTNDFVYVK